MKADIKQKWVDALRSGEYRQGKEYLQFDGNYCCLGVLCDIAIRDGLLLKVEHDAGAGWYDYDTATLPDRVREWAGLDSCDPVVAGERLSAWNDNEDKSFEQIADLIQEHL
ncbi:hypothetical protein [Nocardia sp. NPDC057440]|uniref:hypothetical protein n=1 Tax=Nocardia sp. NPDC057440 TaxID=3346134 RepID=UPI00366F0EFF